MAECHILPFTIRKKYNLCYNIHNVINGSTSSYLSAQFNKRLPLRRDLRSASNITATATTSSHETGARRMYAKKVRDDEYFENFKKKTENIFF